MAGFQLATAQSLIAQSELPPLLRTHASGPFGLTSLAVESLEALSRAADHGLEARRLLETHILEVLTQTTEVGSSLSLPQLQAPHRQLLASFQLFVTTDAFSDWCQSRDAFPQVEGGLELDGIDSLLDESPEKFLSRALAIASRFVSQTASRQSAATDSALSTIKTFTAGLLLLRSAVRRFGESGAVSHLVGALEAHKISIGALNYRGLKRVDHAEGPPTALLNIQVDDIVGNVEYLNAAKRLARDVAGFDRETRTNPKKLNPILFALGRPGCGKTVTAHAVGRYFLDYCRERDVPAKFLVIRRSDWASSYQNASAANLIRLFEEEVKSFDGVCGIYWPDIDTALASRDSGQLRSEEKQNLGAVFGVFDGTILPKDGSWFLMCDANTMHMDEAAISRIAQNPMTVSGATTAEDYVRMMRDIVLRDQGELLDISDEQWLELGRLSTKHDLSGRNIEAICGNVRAQIQDFEYPEEYFKADVAQRQELIRRLSNRLSFPEFRQKLEEFAQFQLAAEKLEEEQAFNRDVEELTRRLNATRAVAALP